MTLRPLVLAAIAAVAACPEGAPDAPAALADPDVERAATVFDAHRAGWAACRDRLQEAEAKREAGDRSLVNKADLQVGAECLGRWLSERQAELEAAGVPLEKAQTAYELWSGDAPGKRWKAGRR